MFKLLSFLFVVIIFFNSCTKERTVVYETMDEMPLDSVKWDRAGSKMTIDFEQNNSTPEIVLHWDASFGLGGGGHNALYVYTIDSNWQVFTSTYIDTVCMDTVYRNGVRTFDVTNDGSSNNIFSIDTIEFVQQLTDNTVYTAPGIFKYIDTALSYYNIAISPMTAFPDATYRNTQVGASKFVHDNYLIFEHRDGRKKALQYKIFNRAGQPTYNYLMKLYDL